MLTLKELLHNLKDRDWDINPIYKIDENEAKKLIEAIEETDKKIADYTYMIGLLQDRIEEIEKSDKWILCSERLPEPNMPVNIYVNKKFPELANRQVFEGWMIGDYWAVDYSDIPSEFTKCVVAWMPLPEPYKAESEG